MKRTMATGVYRKAVLWAVGIFTVVMLSSCGAHPKTVIYMLFDLSGSTAETSIRESYFRAAVDQVVDKFKEGTVMADVINDNPLTRDSYIEEKWPADSLTANALVVKSQRRKAADNLQGKLRNLLFGSAPTKKTDILNAFQMVEKQLNGGMYGAYANKFLLVFSDMMEESPRHNFKSNLGEREIQAIIDAEKKAGSLPDLKGVKVWVIGANTGTSTPNNTAQIYRIQDFWLAYFKAAGANLTKDRYGPTLLNFSLD